jgi:hypothetical protein
VLDEEGIPVLPSPPKGVRKEDFVQPYYRRLKGARGVACVLTSMEKGRTFVSSTPDRKPPSGGYQLSLHQGVSQALPALLLVRCDEKSRS